MSLWKSFSTSLASAFCVVLDSRLFHSEAGQDAPRTAQRETKLMNDHDTHNEEVLQSKREDFDSFLAKQDWVNAQAVIDSIREDGHEHSADILRKAFLHAQYQSTKDGDTEGETNRDIDTHDHAEWVSQQGGEYLD